MLLYLEEKKKTNATQEACHYGGTGGGVKVVRVIFVRKTNVDKVNKTCRHLKFCFPTFVPELVKIITTFLRVLAGWSRMRQIN